MARNTNFNKDEVLEKTMHLFWAKGFDGTSLDDILKETGLLKGSLYHTFKSKENLFKLCLEKYGIRSKSFFYRDEDDPIDYIRNFFKRLVSEGVKEDAKGCLIMNSCLEFSNVSNELSKENEKLFNAVETNMLRVANKLLKDEKIKTSKSAKQLGRQFVVAAFSIREFSKFRKDKLFLKEIANNALFAVNIKI